jgi:hypothetical protein
MKENNLKIESLLPTTSLKVGKRLFLNKNHSEAIKKEGKLNRPKIAPKLHFFT